LVELNTIQRIVKNVGVSIFAQIIGYILSFFYTIYAARYLGAEGFGILAFALAFTGIFAVFCDLGMGTLTVREVSKNKSLANKYLGNIAVMKIIFVIITFGMIALVINLLGYPGQTINVVYLIALAAILNSFSGMFTSIFQANEKMEYVSVGRIFSSVLMLAGAIFVISHNFSVVGFSSIYLIVNAIVLIYNLVICGLKFVKPRMEIDFSFWKHTIKEALPFALTGTFITIYVWIDSVMLSLMKGDAVVGWYNAAYMTVLALLFIPTAINSAVFPIMSQYYLSSIDSLKFILEKHFKYILTIGIPIGVGITLLADKIILTIYGIDYMPSVIAFQILTWAIVFIFARTAFERVLEASNRQIIVTKVFGGCALLNIILNFILIPKYSYIGASIATLITDFAVFIIIFIFSIKIGYNAPIKRIVKDVSKIIIASLLMGIFIEYFRNQNIFIIIFAAAIIYFGLILVINGINKEDIKLLKNIIPKK